MILAKHRVYSLCELSAVQFVDITGVYLKVLEAITPSLFFTESDLVKTSLARFIPFCHIPEGDLL
jgi:hypothetical protein